jgi:5'(3')-deoxyribonucleotidase
MRRKLAVDIDNTLWDLITPWLDYYNRRYNDNIRYEEIVDYNFFNIIKTITREEMLHLLSEKEFWDNVYPYPTSIPFLKKLNDEFELYIATSTSYKTPREKFDKLFTFFDFLDEDQLIVTSKKQLLNVDIMIDDCADCLIGGDYTKLLIDAPYNRNVKDNKIIRVYNLADAYNFLHA